MSISVHPGCLTATDSKNFLNSLSGTPGWTFYDHQVTHDLKDTDPILVTAHQHLKIPTDNRIAGVAHVTATFKKFTGQFEGSNVFIFLEGTWKGQSNGRSYNFQAGDVVVSNIALQIESSGRTNRWVFISQNVRDLGCSKTTLIRALTGSSIISPDSQIKIDIVQGPVSDLDEEDEEEDDLEEDEEDFSVSEDSGDDLDDVSDSDDPDIEQSTETSSVQPEAVDQSTETSSVQPETVD